ncbi:hypothetical protein C8Q80DRAFT_1205973 [Daedaleopsis nitida]|nr:hypothetical protein C8Q80DRAFT_1205973 [Daedaleopsis nitida]
MITFTADVVQSCGVFSRAILASQVLTIVPCAVFAALRAHAMTRTWIVTALVLCLSMISVGVNLVAFAYNVTGVNVPGIGCLAIDDVTPQLALIFVVTSRTGNIVADSALLLIAWSTLCWRDGSPLPKRLTLNGILFRDGHILLVMNVLHLAFSLNSIFGDTGGSYITVFTEPVTSMLVARFLLDLQEVSQRPMKLGSDHVLHFSSSEADGRLSFGRGHVDPSSVAGFVRASTTSEELGSRIDCICI